MKSISISGGRFWAFLVMRLDEICGGMGFDQLIIKPRNSIQTCIQGGNGIRITSIYPAHMGNNFGPSARHNVWSMNYSRIE